MLNKDSTVQLYKTSDNQSYGSTAVALTGHNFLGHSIREGESKDAVSTPSAGIAEIAKR